MTGNTDAIKAHLDHLRLRGRAPATITGREHILTRCAAHLGPLPLLQATEPDLIAWRSALSGLADASIISAVGHVRAFYAWAADDGHITTSPARRVPVPPMPVYEPRPISEDDLLTAVEGAPRGRVRTWLILGGWGGMRCIEIALLRRPCLRERDQPPHVIIRKDATKGRRRGRVVYLCQWAADEIAAAGLPSSGWCFPRLDGAPGPVSAHLVSNLANEYLHGIGIPDTFHALRHRYATELLDSCGNPRVVQDQLGHASLDMVARYSKVKQARAAAAAAGLPVPRQLPRAG